MKMGAPRGQKPGHGAAPDVCQAPEPASRLTDPAGRYPLGRVPSGPFLQEE